MADEKQPNDRSAKTYKVKLSEPHEFQDNISDNSPIRNPRTGRMERPLRVLKTTTRNYEKGDVVEIDQARYDEFVRLQRDFGFQFTLVDDSTPVSEPIYNSDAPTDPDSSGQTSDAQTSEGAHDSTTTGEDVSPSEEG